MIKEKTRFKSNDPQRVLTRLIQVLVPFIVCHETVVLVVADPSSPLCTVVGLLEKFKINKENYPKFRLICSISQYEIARDSFGRRNIILGGHLIEKNISREALKRLYLRSKIIYVTELV